MAAQLDKGTPWVLLMGKQPSQTTMEANTEFPEEKQKLKYICHMTQLTTLGYLCEELQITLSQRHLQCLTTGLFKGAKLWNQPRYLSTEVWITKM